MERRIFIAGSAAALALAHPLRAAGPGPALDAAAGFDELRAIVMLKNGIETAARGYNGFTPDRATNIKSASKSIISGLVGMAIDRGLLEGPDQPIAPLLRDQLPRDPDPRIERVTIGHLLSMQAGLERTSGRNYGRWVSSGNWVRAALSVPFVDEPGGGMLYSTGSSHILAAILTRVGGRSLLALARDWLAPLDGFEITGWDRDPQGIYMGGNQMAMSTRSLAAWGALYERGGVTADGTRLLSQAWIDATWTRRTRSVFHRDGYGYGWFSRQMGGAETWYGWGYGGQMLYVTPARGTVIAITSDPDRPSARTGYRDALHGLAEQLLTEA
ncbi:serine hydrolase [Halovulum dunhuangense]|uniref:Serine hydrolase n=1 Tax=Halovulum dunhuangense TaxID=1505036 RepID=A0A849KY63_9RHOB|nr:serine hydrolase [Halovulum dunhuangense]NNU78946.1 serine hydrolase [Halovulum dunhuangense]